jgi:hypothetical protein
MLAKKKTRQKKNFLLMKPHHFLDIIKLYGAGFKEFVPDEKFGHNFWKVGNWIIQKPTTSMKLTVDNDFICVPCKFSNGKICIDTTFVNSGEISKDKFNKTIDKRIFKKLGLDANSKITALEFCKLAKEKLNAENIFEIWKEKSTEETKERARLLFLGIEKYLARYGG